MAIKKIPLFTIVSLLFLFGFIGITHAFPASGEWRRINDEYKNSNAPSSGNEIKEQFGTMTLRLPTTLSHAYSKRSAWNIDDSLLMLGGKIVDGNNYRVLRGIPVASERVWSNTQANVIYGFTYNTGKFQKVDANTGNTELLRDFSNYGKCTIGDFEGSISNDDQYILLKCGNTLISYNVKSDSILGTITAKSNFNRGSFVQSGKYILVENNAGSPREIVRYDKNLNNRSVLTNFSEHGDMGIDKNGDDIYLMVGDSIKSVRIKDGKIKTLIPAPASYGHISCRNIYRPGYCYFSAKTGGTIGSINLDNGNVEYFGFHRSTWGSYALQPKASVNSRGTKMIFTSDWFGKTGKNDYITEVTNTNIIPTPEPNSSTSSSSSSSSGANGVCNAIGNSRNDAISNFEAQCPGRTRVDCDPVSGGWECSTHNVGSESSSGGGSSTSSSTSSSSSSSGGAGECIDTDGDGYGWDGEKTCDPNENGRSSSSSTSGGSESSSSTSSSSSSSGGNAGKYNPGDLIALHYDHAPDKDDGHAAAAGYTIVNQMGLNYIAVGGAYGDDNKNTYNSDSEAVMNAVFGSDWLDAHANWNASVNTAANRWEQTIRGGGEVLVAEGGQADFSADVIRELQNRGITNTRSAVIIVQHSKWNEDMANNADLAFTQSNANYIKIADGNNSGNGTADLNEKSNSFVNTARSSQYSRGWNAAFSYLNPSSAKLDFSDTVELLDILEIGTNTINNVNDFADVFFSENSFGDFTGSSSSGSSGGSSSGQGLVIFEAEEVSGDIGSWKRATNVPSYSGGGHLTFDGNSYTNGPANSPLRYTFTANQSGEYRLMMKIRRFPVAGHNDYANDGYVRLEGDFSPGSGAPSLTQLKQNTKYFGGATSWSWNPAAPLDVGHTKYRATYNLTAGRSYTLVLSGRSKGWSVDRIVFAHSSVSDSAAQNGAAGGGSSSSGGSSTSSSSSSGSSSTSGGGSSSTGSSSSSSSSGGSSSGTSLSSSSSGSSTSGGGITSSSGGGNTDGSEVCTSIIRERQIPITSSSSSSSSGGITSEYYINNNGQAYAPTSDACYVKEESLGKSRTVFERECRGKKRVDCDPMQGGYWICSNEQIGLYTPGNNAGNNGININGGTFTKGTGGSSNTAESGYRIEKYVEQVCTPVVGGGSNGGGTTEACSVTEVGYITTLDSFENQCGGTPFDCDPISNGQWVCATYTIEGGDNDSSGASSSSSSGGSSSSSSTSSSSSSSSSGGHCNPSNSSSSSGGSATGNEGLIVLEAEEASGNLGEWIRSTSLSGYSGDGHLTFEGNSIVNGPANSPLTYTFTADRDGEYRLLMRMQRRAHPTRNDLSNDGYVRLAGDFTAGSGAPSLDDLKKDTKYYGGGLSWAWNPGSPLDIHEKKWKATYNLEAGKTYTLTLSGRSQGWSVDRLVFAHSSVADRTAQSATKSQISTEDHVNNNDDCNDSSSSSSTSSSSSSSSGGGSTSSSSSGGDSGSSSSSSSSSGSSSTSSSGSSSSSGSTGGGNTSSSTSSSSSSSSSSSGGNELTQGCDIIVGNTNDLINAVRTAGKVCISPGTIHVPNTLNINNGVILKSQFSSSPAIISIGASERGIVVNGNNVNIENIIIDGNNTAASAFSLMLSNANNVKIIDTIIQNTQGIGVAIYRTNGVELNNVTITNIGQDPALRQAIWAANDSRNIVIDGLEVNGRVNTEHLSDHAITCIGVDGFTIRNSITRNPSSGAIAINACSNVVIENNELYNGTEHGVDVVNGARNVIVRNNHIEGFTRAGMVFDDHSWTTNVGVQGNPTNIVITGNTMVNNNKWNLQCTGIAINRHIAINPTDAQKANNRWLTIGNGNTVNKGPLYCVHAVGKDYNASSGFVLDNG